jgi:predicted PurR-regulated permease PerM
MSSDSNRKIDRIVDALEQLTIDAEAKQSIADNAINQMNIASQNIISEAQSLKGLIEQKVKTSIQEEIRESLVKQSLLEFKQKAEDFKQKADEFNDTTKNYLEKTQKNIWRVVIALIIIQLIVFCGFSFFLNSEIQSLKKENQQLKAFIAVLKKKGSLIKRK